MMFAGFAALGFASYWRARTRAKAANDSAI
jgi:hypothetical protein